MASKPILIVTIDTPKGTLALDQSAGRVVLSHLLEHVGAEIGRGSATTGPVVYDGSTVGAWAYQPAPR
jgi:hypothetical protein